MRYHEEVMSMSKDDSYTAKFDSYQTEIENGIFNMIISLCQQRAEEVGMDQAKQEISNWLERLIKGLRE